jgi:hypothetical protein
VNTEFNVWLLVVGLVIGAGLVWVVMLDGRRREFEVEAVELPREAAWLAAVLSEDGYDVSAEAAEQLLLLHRAYLAAPPPDPFDEEPVDMEPRDELPSAPGRPPDRYEVSQGTGEERTG